MMRMKEGLRMAPPEVIECLKAAVGTENFERMKAGTLTPGPQIGEQVRACFEKFMPRPTEGMQPQKSGMPPGGMTGPGGCSTPEECFKFCSEHPEECKSFGAQKGGGSISKGEFPGGSGGLPGGFSGPGGCKSQEECVAYCKDHPEECKNFGAPGTPAVPTIPGVMTTPPEPTDILQSICPSFAAVPSCDYVGPVGSQSYNYCKQCYPDK